jgi:hypothetical protein
MFAVRRNVHVHACTVHDVATCMCVLQRLLGCEGVKLDFTPEAIKELATMAEQLNKEVGAVHWGQDQVRSNYIKSGWIRSQEDSGSSAQWQSS